MRQTKQSKSSRVKYFRSAEGLDLTPAMLDANLTDHWQITDATFKLKEKFPINTWFYFGLCFLCIFFLLSIYYHIIKVIKRALFPVPAPLLQINKIHTKSALSQHG